MSRATLQALYDARAFKPAPSLWELALAHVPFAELDADQPPEPRVRYGLEERDGLALLLGGPGSGKSSVLAHVADAIADEPTPAGYRYLPVFVPVAGRPEIAQDLSRFGKGVARELLRALHDGAPAHVRARIGRAMAEAETVQHGGSRFNAKVAAKAMLPGGEVGGELGLDLAGDVASIITAQDLDPFGGIKTLGDIARTRGFELLLFIEDTDAWARSPEGDGTARAFFNAILRPLASDVDVGVAVAIQSAWEELDELAAILTRAVAVARVPEATGQPHATAMITRVLERRIANGLPDRSTSPEAVFTSDALSMLGYEVRRSGGMREPLVRVRDTFDRHADDLPDRFDRHHLLESI